MTEGGKTYILKKTKKKKAEKKKKGIKKMNRNRKKVDFVTLIYVNGANPNGDPAALNDPRTDLDGYGVISRECMARKMRNRLQEMGNPIFVQTEGAETDGYRSLEERFWETMKEEIGQKPEKAGKTALTEKAKALWQDVRLFGQVFAFKGGGDASFPVRGALTVNYARSVCPVQIEEYGITKSVNGCQKDDGKKASDRMGTRKMIRSGLYVMRGSINGLLSEKNGVTEDDVAAVKEALRTLFLNDASAARPDGSMEVVKVFWFDHGCQNGKYSSAKVFRTVDVKPLVDDPLYIDDYQIDYKPLEGLDAEIIEGY